MGIKKMLKRIVLGMALCTIGLAHAQTQADIDAANREAIRLQQLEQQRHERDRSLWEQEQTTEGADLDAMAPKVAQQPETACREIKTVILTGTTQMSALEKKQMVAPYESKCLGATEIEHLLADVTAFYIQGGFVTARAYLPAQDLTTGKLEILVVEGIIEKLELDDGGKKSVLINMAFPNMTGQLLNLRDLEQGIDQINRLQSNNASMQILPGAKPGASVVKIHNEPSRRWHLNFSGDNQGSRSTGHRQISGTVMLDNPLGINDSFNLTHRQTHPSNWAQQMSRSDSVDYSFPLGYNTISYSHSFSKYVSTVNTASGEALKSNGDNGSTAMGIERTVYRNQVTRATLAAKLTAKGGNNYLAEQLLEVSSRKLTVLDIDGTYTTSLFQGIVNFNLGYARGLDVFSALRDETNLPASSPHAQFGKIKYGANFNRPFKLGALDANFKSSMSGQQALDTLYGSEQQLVGGIYTVRGFINNTISGDNGYFWTNEFSLKVPTNILNASGIFRPYAGIDHGRATSRFGNAPGGSITGMAVGFSWQLGIFSLDLFNTRPIAVTSYMGQHESARTYLSLKLAI